MVSDEGYIQDGCNDYYSDPKSKRQTNYTEYDDYDDE